MRSSLIRGRVTFAVCAGALASAFSARPLTAQSAASKCQSTEYHQFDFWAGDWTVRDSTGTVIGTNTVTHEASGCALAEHWKGAGGSTGTSVNYYDSADGRWHQLWVGSGGLILHLRGRLVDDAMVLQGVRTTPKGSVHDRITWTPLADGRVRQAWEISTDDGTTWRMSFVGYYGRTRPH